jgi:hypothetical protein
MALPVSEKNELQVVDTICGVCEKALEDLKQCKEGGPESCTKLRESETKALTLTLEYLQRQKEALDLKEYYQQHRLNDLGLDSIWSTEDDMETATQILDLDRHEYQAGHITIGKLTFYLLSIQYLQRLIEQERISDCIIDLL